MSIGSNIKRYRKLKGLTQEQLAIKVGLSKVAIQKYETNKREPKNIIVSKIAEVLNVSTIDLYKDKSIEDVVQAKEIIPIDNHTDLVKIIKDYKYGLGISYKTLAERIGISSSTLEDIVYGIRPGKDNTREKIYNYIMSNDSSSKILNMYREKENIKRILSINKTIHKLLGPMYVVELVNKDDNIAYEVLLEREVL